MTTAEHKRVRPLVMLYLWISRCWVKGGKGKKGKGEKKGKGKGKGKKGESNKDEKDKDKDKKGKGKGKNNAKAEYFAGYCIQCQRLLTHEEGLLVERECSEWEGHCISGDSDYVSWEHKDGTTDHWNVDTV